MRVSDPKALADLVRDASQQRKAIVDYGVAHTGLGHPPPAEHFSIQLEGGIIEHYKRDMAVRASTGITIGQLQAELAPHDQFLPVDADDDLTLGEVITHNVYGPLRVGYGSARDLLLGLHYIDGKGRDIHVGGRTVKNVAGYDLTRFMVGSLGQFGIIHEATLRTYAIPEHVTRASVRVEDPTTIDRLLTNWMLTDAAPTHMQLQRINNEWRLHVGYFGSPSACSIQLRALESHVESEASLHLIETHECDLAADSAHRADVRHWLRQVSALVKLIVPPSASGATCKALADWGDQEQNKISIEAMPVHGCVFAGGDLDDAAAQKLDQQINRMIEPSHGMRVWYAQPSAAAIEPFGPPQNDWAILTALKLTMDPRNLLNPERFIRLEGAAS